MAKLSSFIKTVALFLLVDGFGASSVKARPKRKLCDMEEAPAEKKFTNLVFEDNFDTFNLKNWFHARTLRGGGNWEFQIYENDRRTSYVKDGSLILKPILTTEFLNITDAVLTKNASYEIKEGCTDSGDYGCSRATNEHGILNPVASARVNLTKPFRYGKVEIRAKIPKGDWLWPALWFVPAKDHYGSWPASGEIDLMESRGNAPGKSAGPGVDTVSSTLHFGPDFHNNRYDMNLNAKTLPAGKDYSQDYHTYKLEWTEDYLKTWVDEDQLVDMDFTKIENMFKYGGFSGNNPWAKGGRNAPFDQEFYLVMNVAVGGTLGYFPDFDKNGKKDENKPWENNKPFGPNNFYKAKDSWLPTWEESGYMAIDYVRLYQ